MLHKVPFTSIRASKVVINRLFIKHLEGCRNPSVYSSIVYHRVVRQKKKKNSIPRWNLSKEPANRISDEILCMLIWDVRMVHEVGFLKQSLGQESSIGSALTKGMTATNHFICYDTYLGHRVGYLDWKDW